MKNDQLKRCKKLFFEYSTTVALGVGLYLAASACSKVASYPSSTSVANTPLCPPQVGGEPLNCCSTTGSLIMPPPTGCPNPVTGNGGIKGSLVGGAAAAGATVSAANAASALASNNAGATNPFAKLSAATAGGTITTPNLSGATSAGTATTPNAVAQSALGGGGGAGGGGSAGAGLSPMSTAPAGDQGGAAPTDPGVDPNVASAYTTGGSAAGANGGGNRDNSVFGGLGGLFGAGAGGVGGGAGGSPSELGFGTNRSPASAMGSSDPEDYFSRISLTDSLFKRVETRYRNKQIAWASVIAAPAAQQIRLAPAKGSSIPR